MKNIETNADVMPANPNIDFKAVFTGEALLTVEAVNPTKDELISIKGLENIADRIEDPQYTNIKLKSDTFTKIEFLLSFSPNEILGVNNYADKYFVSYPVFINSDLDLNKDGTKAQVIDQHNQSIWIPYIANKTPKEMLESYRSNLDQYNYSDNYTDYINSIDPETVRVAKQGEVNLYQFIFNMTHLPRHGGKIRNSEETFSLDGFVLGGNIDPTAASEYFDKLVAGDVSYIREVMASGICEYKNGNKVRVGALLGVRINDSNSSNVKFYQEILTSRWDICTFKETAIPNSKVVNGKSEKTRLSNNAFARLTDTEYPWRNKWQNSFEFKPYDKSSYKPTTTTTVGAPGSGQDDDLPF